MIKKGDSIQQFCNLILRQGLIDSHSLFQFYQHYLTLRIQAFQCVYSFHQEGRLSLLDQEQKELNGLDLPRPTPYTGKWIDFTTNNIALFNATGEFMGLQALHAPQLSPAPWGGLVWVSQKAYHLDYLLYHAIPAENCQQGPFDIYLPSGQTEGLYLSDRGAGKLYVLDQTLTHLQAALQIRPSGSKKAINSAWSPRFKQSYLTDHVTSDLIAINPHGHTQQRTTTHQGILGNVVLDDRAGQLFVVLADPDKAPAILVFGLPDLQLKATIPLPGNRFSSLDDPCDLLALSQDGRYIYVMSYVDQPALMTPLISVLDTLSHQVIQSHELKKEDKPSGIAFLKSQVSPQSVPDFEQLLLQKGLLKEEALKNLLGHMDKLEQEHAKPALAKDVVAASARLQSSFSQEELDSVSTLSEQVMNELLHDPVFQWEGRDNMSKEEKRKFVESLATFKPAKEVSQTNAVFVLNWIKGLMG